jgi:hypothetical protein
MSADIELNWEWPADRTAEKKLLIKIDSVKKESAGFFSIQKSPSLASSLPDPKIVIGTVISNDSDLNGKRVKVVAPTLEIEDLNPNAYAVIGIVETNTCICIIPVASKETDLTNINCP